VTRGPGTAGERGGRLLADRLGIVTADVGFPRMTGVGGAVDPGEGPRRLMVMNGLSRPHGVAWPMRHRAWFPAFVAARILLISLAVAACGSATSAGPASPGFTGYDWQVVAISHGGKVTSIPARLRVALRFSPGGQFGASDGVNFYGGTYRTAGDGFTTSVLAGTLAGYAGHDPAVLLAISAIGSFGDGARASVELTGGRLVVGVGSYTLTCQRRGPQADVPAAPAGTGDQRALTGRRPLAPMQVIRHTHDLPAPPSPRTRR
jgi:hypothetical protein